MNSWLDAIPWLVAVFGWLATHVLSEARERRKEARGRLDSLIEKSGEVERAALDFHRSDSFDANVASDLIAALDRLERSALRVEMLNQDSLAPAFVFQRRAITLLNFDPSTFKRQEGTSPLLAEIPDALAEFEDELERQYAARYPSHFPYFTRSAFFRASAGGQYTPLP